jgi:hypothetical protein
LPEFTGGDFLPDFKGGDFDFRVEKTGDYFSSSGSGLALLKISLGAFISIESSSIVLLIKLSF